MFDALVNERFEKKGDLSFTAVMKDIEELNQHVIAGIPDVSKISAALYPSVSSAYQILFSGAAIGYGQGPLLIGKHFYSPAEFSRCSVAIPGVHTTANLLLSVAFPSLNRKKEYLFSLIEEAVLRGETDLGLIIHETRFTYAARGLQKVVDLGEYWEETYHKAIPLGLIVVRRTLPEAIKKEVNRLIGQSVQYALDHPTVSLPYVKAHARELSDEVVRQHINLYVNPYSVHFGSAGKEAIDFLFRKGHEAGLLPPVSSDIYVNE